ncbi:MAG: hypothetical protein LBU32_14465 [Clostridiales bacterium]|nr:hypothetical protein [Clostridiales bacterium]
MDADLKAPILGPDYNALQWLGWAGLEMNALTAHHYNRGEGRLAYRSGFNARSFGGRHA